MSSCGAKAVAGKVAGSALKQAAAEKAVSTVMGGNKKKEQVARLRLPSPLSKQATAFAVRRSPTWTELMMSRPQLRLMTVPRGSSRGTARGSPETARQTNKS